MSYKREINRFGKIKHIIKEDDKLVVGLFEPDCYKDMKRNDYTIEEVILFMNCIDLLSNPMRKIAVCKEPDVYNKEIGMDIVDTKLLIEYHKKMKRKYEILLRRLTKLCDKLTKSITKEEDMIEDAKKELNKYVDNE